MYAKIRIPRRSAPNQRKRYSTKETPKLADLRRLMTDPNLRCQDAKAMVDALPPIPDDTCISDIATEMDDVMLSTAAELIPRCKRPRGAQGWYAGPGVETEMNAAWQQREEARRHLRAEPHNSNLRKAMKMAEKKLRKVRKAAVLSFSLDFVRKLETRTRGGDQAGFYKDLKTMNLEGKRDRSSAYVKDENGVLLKDVELIIERWVRWFHTLFNAKSPRLDPNIAEGLDQWPENMPLGVQPTMQELTDAIRSLANGKSVTKSPLTCSRSPSAVTLLCAGDCSISSFVSGGGARCRSSAKLPSSWYSIKEGSDRVRQLQGHLTGSARRQDPAEDHRSPPEQVQRARGDPAGGAEWFPTEPFYHRYDVCDSSVTGAGAEETNSAVSMLYRPDQSVRLCGSNPSLDSTRPFWRATEYDLGHSSIPRWHARMRAARRQGVLGVVRCGTRQGCVLTPLVFNIFFAAL